jgi:hypothetical protein
MTHDRSYDNEPAVIRAWRRLDNGLQPTSNVSVLQDKPKASVYAFNLLPDQTPVVAKRASIEQTRVEQLLYEHILPSTGVPALACYGVVVDETCGWLFVERGTGGSYNASDAGHRKITGSWLGAFHTAAFAVGQNWILPVRSAQSYFDALVEVSTRLEDACSRHVDAQLGFRFLEDGARLLDRLQLGWIRVESIISALPNTVIHGDFASKNIVVGATGHLHVFDWGTAGWGSPAPDLPQNVAQEDYWAHPELSEYERQVARVWGKTDVRILRRVAAAGAIMRTVTELHGDTQALGSPWAANVIYKLPVYLEHLSTSMDAIGITHGPHFTVAVRSM